MDDLILPDVDSLAARVADGAKLAIVKNKSGVPMAAVRALIRRGVKDLHVVGVPTSGLPIDMLVGAGCVVTVESAGVTLDEFGQSPCFGRAAKSGEIRLKDSTCPAVYAGLQAAEKGIPFMPLRGLIGSDIARYRDDYKVIENPFGENDPIVALPAIQPDVALIHAPFADRQGNVWIGRQRELQLMAHAARETLVTVEEIVDGDLLRDETLAPATIPAFYVHGVAVAEKGAWPLNLPGRYDEDEANLALYARQAATPDGFAAYLAEYVTDARVAAE